MDIRKTLLVKSSGELLTGTACLSPNNKRKPQISNVNLPYIEGIGEKLWRILTPHKIRSIFYTKSFV